ncbi:hypothetical protein BC834DRAFT_39979 [Gloeopeniophorella convolvens]|nr:hypothetical protein BC834DRAFT_39979 [Gloeopeniophorella convolvens]
MRVSAEQGTLLLWSMISGPMFAPARRLDGLQEPTHRRVVLAYGTPWLISGCYARGKASVRSSCLIFSRGDMFEYKQLGKADGQFHSVGSAGTILPYFWSCCVLQELGRSLLESRLNSDSTLSGN